MSIIRVTVIDREGVSHELEAPTDMNMNVMELCRSAELPVEGTCGGMAMCASCHCYVESAHRDQLPSLGRLVQLSNVYRATRKTSVQ